MRRYEGYDIAARQADRDSHAELIGAGASSTVISNRVSSCNVAYTPGTAQRAGLISLALAVSEAGETVSLLYQVHVDNVP
jgi:MSHA biogenesis protein MshO